MDDDIKVISKILADTIHSPFTNTTGLQIMLAIRRGELPSVPRESVADVFRIRCELEKAQSDRDMLIQAKASAPIPMRLSCPECNAIHIDEGEFATKPHHTHACQSCGMVWRPAVVPTVGVRFLPGFKNVAPGGVIHA